jgi:hypothetical protein
MRKLVSPGYVWTAVGLYGLGVTHDIGAAYGLPSDGLDHSAPAVALALNSTGTGISTSISYYTTDTVTGVDLSSSARYEYFKFKQAI